MLTAVIQNWPIVLFAAITLTLMIVAIVSLRDGPPPYERRGVLLSPSEINFLRSLQLAVRDDWLIFSMVAACKIGQLSPLNLPTFSVPLICTQVSAGKSLALSEITGNPIAEASATQQLTVKRATINWFSG